MNRSRSLPGAWLDSLIVAASALVVYVATLAPGCGPGDSGELTTAVWMLGVCHPTGYPLYTLLGHAYLKLVPFGSVAFRMNLFSALAMAAGMALFYGVARRIIGRRLPSLAAALLLAFTPGLWSQALIAEVYGLHIMLSMAALLAGLEWDRRGGRRRLLLTALLYGLCFTHHLLSVLLAPGLLYLAVTSRHRAELWRALPAAVLCFLAPLSLYLYIPWTAFRDPPLNWGDARTWDNFVAHVTGRQYRELMFTMPGRSVLEQLRHYGAYLPKQFGYPLLALGVLGLGRLALTRRRWLWGTGLFYVVSVVYALNYHIFDVEVYYLPSNCVLALWVAAGLSWLLRFCAVRLHVARRAAGGGVVGWGGGEERTDHHRTTAPPHHPTTRRAGRRTADRLAWGACVVIPALMLAGQWQAASQRDLHWPQEYGRGYLASVAPNAVIFGGGDDTYFPLLYAKYVEGRRPDVTLFSYNDTLYPERTRLFERLEAQGLRAKAPICIAWHLARHERHHCYLRSLLAQNVGGRPVYMVGPDTTMTDWNMRQTLSPYWRIQTSNQPGWRIERRPRPLAAAPQRPTHPASITFGDAARFLGYDAEPFQRDGVAMLRVRYHWDLRMPIPSRGLKVWVLFTDERGNYRRHPNGSPRFHNTHWLGQGRPLAHHVFPQRICEDFDVVVPPDEVNCQRRLRVALDAGAGFLPTLETPGERFSDVGSIGTRLLAADEPPGAWKERRWQNPGPAPAALRRHAPSL